MDDLLAKYKRLIIGLVLFLLVVVPIFSYIRSEINKRGKVAVEVFVVPHDAQITINGKKSRTKTYLTPGNYTFKAERSGFTSQENEITITNETTFALTLDPISEEAKRYAENNQRRYLEAEAIAGTQTRNEGGAFRQKNPIISQLPTRTNFYSIDYRASEQSDDGIVIEIRTENPTGRAFALRQISSWGYDVTDYRIDFIEHIDPFKNIEPAYREEDS